MAYSAISIVAPEKAKAGETVDLEVRITNLAAYTIYPVAVVRIDGIVLEGSYQPLVPQPYSGSTRSRYFSFVMPEKSVTVKAESWCESYYFEWRLDATASRSVSLEELAPAFSEFAIVDYRKV